LLSDENLGGPRAVSSRYSNGFAQKNTALYAITRVVIWFKTAGSAFLFKTRLEHQKHENQQIQ